MKIDTYVKRVEPKPYDEVMVKLDREEYEAKFIIDLLEELETTSLGMIHVAIHDDRLRKSLNEAGIIGTSIRGSSYMSNEAKLKNLKRKLVKAYDKFHCDEGGSE